MRLHFIQLYVGSNFVAAVVFTLAATHSNPEASEIRPTIDTNSTDG